MRANQKQRGVSSQILLGFQDRVSELPAGPQPPFFEKLFNLMPAATIDRKPANSSFGDVLQQVYPLYRQVRRHHDMAHVCPPGFRTLPAQLFHCVPRAMSSLSRS